MRFPVRRSNTSTVLCSSAARNRRLPLRSKPKWSKSPVKPGIGVVVINFSGSFSCAFTVSTHEANMIVQILSDCRNLSPQEMLLIALHFTRALPYLDKRLIRTLYGGNERLTRSPHLNSRVCYCS